MDILNVISYLHFWSIYRMR